MATIEPNLLAEINRLAEQGNSYYERDNGERQALNTWRSALSLLPKPHAQYEESVWLYACIGDAQADLGNPQDALRSYEAAYEGPEGHLNPYVLLQMGKILADTGRWELARDRLMRAYMLEGKDMFDGGDQPYLDRLREDEEIVL